MWTATIVDKQWSEGFVTVNISFSDGTRKFNQLCTLRDGTELDGFITMRTSQLQKLDVFDQKLSFGVYTPIVVMGEPNPTL